MSSKDDYKICRAGLSSNPPSSSFDSAQDDSVRHIKELTYEDLRTRVAQGLPWGPMMIALIVPGARLVCQEQTLDDEDVIPAQK